MRPHRRPPADSAVSVELEIPFHDVDLLQVVWHGHYFKYLEIARTLLLRTRGLDSKDMPTLGYRLYVVESCIRHVFPMRYSERLRVSAWFRDVESKLDISYELTNLTHGRACARASTVLVTTTVDGTLCFETPAPLLERLRAPGPGRAP